VSQDTSVSVVTRIRAGWPGFNPKQRRRFFSSSPNPKGLWSPPSLLFYSVRLCCAVFSPSQGHLTFIFIIVGKITQNFEPHMDSHYSRKQYVKHEQVCLQKW